MAKLSKQGKLVVRYARMLDRGLDAAEDGNVAGIISVAEELIRERFHNPWWAGLIAISVGRVLIKSAFTPIKRLGWTMIGVGGAQTATEATRFAVEMAERIKNLKGAGIVPATEEAYRKGGIGEP